MIKLPTREDFERYCKANNERNPRHPEYYSHLPARQQWDAWQAAIAEVQRLNATAQPVKLPTTRLWAGKVGCYSKEDVISMLKSLGLEVSE